MKALKISISCLFMLATLAASATAEPAPPDASVPPAPTPAEKPDSGDSDGGVSYMEVICRPYVDVQMQACRAELATCQGALTEAQKACPPAPATPSKARTRRIKRQPKPPAYKILVVFGERETIAPGEICENGGYAEPFFIDLNGNGEVDGEERWIKTPACKGDKGDPGEPGKPGANARMTPPERFESDPACPAGGSRTTPYTDLNGNGALDAGEENGPASITCDGKSGSSGRPGQDGSNTTIQVGLGVRATSVFTADRPNGYSIAPELQVDYWLAPTVSLSTGVAWAWTEDRGMAVTVQLCKRGLNNRLGLCGGLQYQAWNLVGLEALWHSGLGVVSGKFVPIDTEHVDVSLEAGVGGGFDGYDEEMQPAFGATGQGVLTFKF